MKRRNALSLCAGAVLLATHSGQSTLAEADGVAMPDRRSSPPITWSELGSRVTAQYSGDGLAVITAPQGVVRLRCAFQKLEGQATREGLWLNSTAEGMAADRLRVVADAVGRNHSPMVSLALRGAVEHDAGVVRFVRPAVQEEYSVSADGVRQDFVIAQSPAGTGQLRVELAVTGARAEAVAEGAKLVLQPSGRKLAYDRLRVNDAAGKELPAKLEVVSDSRLAVLVDDSSAAYPIRIDPTFSDANWVSMGGYPGVGSPGSHNGSVKAAVVDGSGNLYIGGSFTAVGDIFATNVAKWNGTNWSALGFSITGSSFGLGPVNALAFSGNTLYVGGSFTNACGIPANRIVQWDGTNWSALGSGLGGGGWSPTFISPNVLALAVSGNDLYAGGWFTTAGDTDAYYVAKWDGSSWSTLGSGMDLVVGALAISGTDLYAGGRFTTADGIVCNGIAKWDGNGWSALGSGVSGDAGPVNSATTRVYSLATSGTDLYAGGRFTHANGILVNGIAKWDGSAWSPLGSGMKITPDSGGFVYSLAMFGGNLYAGGLFTNAGGVTCYSVAKWDGQSWSNLGAGVGTPEYLLDDHSGSVSALVSANGSLYVGGDFALAGDVAATGIAKWSGTNWSALANGLNRFLTAWAVSGDQIYAGGWFQGVGPERANFIARWNGSGWSALGFGLRGPVQCLASSGTELYAGGIFETNGLSVNYVSKWNGSQWTSLGTPPDQPAALAVFQGQLYVGGFYVGGYPSGVAKWSGTNWSSVGPIGGDFYGRSVRALLSNGNFLFAGGYFTDIGGISANNVAMWDGTSWSALGSGMAVTTNIYLPQVLCLAMGSTGRDLYAGGIFDQAGNAFVKNIARWDGTNWSALGSGVVDGAVDFMVASEGDLYVSGNFDSAGGISVNGLAKWNGSRWSALGSGVFGGPLAIAGGQLLVGNDYAGSNPISAFAVRAYLERPTLAIKKTGANVTLSWPTFYSDFVLEQNANLANPNGWAVAGYPLVTNGAIKSATTSVTPTNRFFRLVE